MLRLLAPLAQRGMGSLFLALLACLLLQACGGGGANEPATEPDIDAQRESLLSEQASHFSVAESGSSRSRQGAVPFDGVATTRLLVIDTRTGRIVETLPLAASTSSWSSMTHGQWLTSQRQLRDAHGNGYGNLGLRQLFYIQNGQLLQKDLSGETPGAPQRIFDMTVCSILGLGYIFDDDEGRAGWLPVSTPDPATGQCGDDPSKLPQQLVSVGGLGAPSGKSITWSAHHHPIALLKDAQRLPLGILALDRSGEKVELVLLSPSDMKIPLQTLSLGEDAPLSSEEAPAIAMMFPWPDGAQQAILRIGLKLRALDWRDGTLRLGPTLLTLQSTDSVSSINHDSERLYIAEGCLIHQIDAQGKASPFATIPGSGGSVIRMLPGKTHMLVQKHRPIPGDEEPFDAQPVGHGCPAEAAQPATTVYAVSRSSGVVKQLLTQSSAAYLELLGAAGDEAYIMRDADFGVDILRYDMDSGASETLAQHVDPITYSTIAPRHTSFIDEDIGRHQLMWCKISRVDGYLCEAGDEIVSYVIAAKREVSLGRMPSLREKLPAVHRDSYMTMSLFNSREGLVANNPGLLELYVTIYESESDTLELTMPWMVTPGVANSLREIPGSLPDMP